MLKIKKKKLVEKTKQLQNEKECKIQAEGIDLKQVISVSNNSMFNFQEELKANYIVILILQNEIDVSMKVIY